MELNVLGLATLLKHIKAKSAVTLPIDLPPGTQFLEFRGLPITADLSLNVLAWDVPGGRRFANVTSSPDCALISEARFRALVQHFF
jgi:hypothetical protein